MFDVRFKRLTETAIAPTRAHTTDAAYDFCSDGSYTIENGQVLTVPTGIAFEMPNNVCGLVLSRSGLAAQYGVFVANAPGLIDPGYKGEIKVVLINLGGSPVLITRGDRVAQVLFNPVLETPEILNEVEVLSDSDRGQNGLGSTGRESFEDGFHGVAI